MNLIFDELLFDNRRYDINSQTLFTNDFPSADLVAGWVRGEVLNKNELELTASIIIFYPEYINTKKWFKKSLDLLTDQNIYSAFTSGVTINKALFLYCLLYLNLKCGRFKEAEKLYYEIEKYLSSSFSPGNIPVSGNTAIHLEQLKDAYRKILSLVLDSVELAALPNKIRICDFPTPPYEFSRDELLYSRDMALHYLKSGRYHRAHEIYCALRLNKYEMPSTLTHFARLALAKGDYKQVQYHTCMAWRLRKSAPEYVICRIVFLIIIMQILQAKPFMQWLRVLRKNTEQGFYKMYWDIDFVIKKYEKKMSKKNYRLLNLLLEVISGNASASKAKQSKLWNDTQPLPVEYWPEYELLSAND